MAYGSPRYSEDLDFNSALGEDEAYSALETAVKELEYFGRDITKGLVRIDVSLRGEIVSENRITVRTEYDDVKTYIISAASLDHIVAEKVRALLVRGMERDLYDKTYSQEEMIESIAKLEKSWTKDLKPLLGVFVPYDVAAKGVIERFGTVR